MEHIIWDREFECADRKKIKELQLERLRHTVQYCYDNVPHYRKKFSEIGLKPEHIKTLRDIEKIPFTTKEDFRANYPYDMFAVPMKEIVRLHGSSGTTGNPVVTGYTRHDLDMWTGLVSRVACAAGVVPDDIAQISFGYGLFTGGFGLHYGLERVGLSVIPVSSGNTKRQIKFMQDFGSTVLISTPSYAMYLGETAQEMGIDFKKLKLRLGLFGGEGHTKEMQKQIEKYLNITDTENYGLTEVIGPGFSGECYIQNGMHIADDEFISEVIDPETGEVLPMGEKGELVVTSLTKEGVPILRYRTKDITRLMDEPCKCGRTTTRMEKVSGRTDDMLVIRGVNVFPSQIEGVLLGMDDVAPHYEIVLTTEKHLDRIEVKVEVADAELLTSYSALENLREKIANNIYSILNMHVKVTLAEPHTLQRFEGTARRVTAMRSQ